MTWWGTDLGNKSGFQPKQKNRFIVEFGDGALLSLKSFGKPTATIESKEYRLIYLFQNYPGLVKWEQISMTFVDAKLWATSLQSRESMGQIDSPPRELKQLFVDSGEDAEDVEKWNISLYLNRLRDQGRLEYTEENPDKNRFMILTNKGRAHLDSRAQ